MSEFTFDFKAFVTVYVRGEGLSLANAKADAIEAMQTELDKASDVGGVRIELGTMGPDGEPELAQRPSAETREEFAAFVEEGLDEIAYRGEGVDIEDTPNGWTYITNHGRTQNMDEALDAIDGALNDRGIA